MLVPFNYETHKNSPFIFSPLHGVVAFVYYKHGPWPIEALFGNNQRSRFNIYGQTADGVQFSYLYVWEKDPKIPVNKPHQPYLSI